MDSLLAGLPDLALTLFFIVSSAVALSSPQSSKHFAQALSGWMIFEMVGIFALLLWVALNEGRPDNGRGSTYRLVTTCGTYLVFALILRHVFKLPQITVLLSAIGGAWALANPFVRRPEPTVFQRGRETALALVAMLVSFYAATFLGGIAEQCLDRPYRYRSAFDTVVMLVMGAIYYPLRWRLAARFARVKR